MLARARQRTVAVTLVDGVRPQMEALRTAFASIVAPSDLRPFSPAELDALVNGVDESWVADGVLRLP